MKTAAPIEACLTADELQQERLEIPAKYRAEWLALASILLGAVGQLIVKGALVWMNARQPGAHSTLHVLEPAAGVLLGLGVYAVGTWFWLKAVSHAAISYLYPLSAVSYVLVALGGHFLLRESIQSGRWIGIGVITLGVALLSLTNMRGSE